MIKQQEVDTIQPTEKHLLPTNDVIFHCLFGTIGNEEITKEFLEKILNKKIGNIDLDLNLQLIRDHYDDKLGILDLRAKAKDGTNYNIEMQNSSSSTLLERLLSYWARLYSGDLKRGNTYDVLAKTILILIVNDEIKKFNTILDKFHTKWQIREEDYKDIILSDDFEIHIIELPKYIRMRENNEYRNMWFDFIIEPNGKEVLQAMEESRVLAEAKKKWAEITADDIIRDRALRLEMEEYDRNTALKEAREEGLAQGIADGLKQGIEQIILTMSSKNLSPEEISSLTQIDIEKVKSVIAKNSNIK